MKKRIFALFLILAMLFAFTAACNKTEVKTSEAPPSQAGDPSTPVSSAPPTTTPSAVAPPVVSQEGQNDFTGELGMYNPDYDYSKNPKYKIAYLVSNNSSGLYTDSGLAFAHWASLSNCEYMGLIDFANDDDAMMAQLPQLARDYDGLVMDANAKMYSRVYEIMEPTGTPWMSFMAAPRDYGYDTLPLLHPYIGFDQGYVGGIFAEYLLNKAATEWPDVPIEEFGFITVDAASAPPLHERETAAYNKVLELNPDMAANRYFPVDAWAVGFDASAAQQVVSTVLSMNPDIKHWLVFGVYDDMSQGAAAAIDQAGYTDTSWVTTFGGNALVTQWDAGVQTSWKSALFLPQTVFTEAIFFSLYAFMNGDATPEDMFPEWKNVHEDTRYGSFATRLLPFYEILFDDYQRMLKWSDVYAGSHTYDRYPLPPDITRDSYPISVPVPANFK